MTANPGLLLGTLFGISVAISIWGATTLDPDVRFRARWGGLGSDFRVSKVTGLVAWPLMCGMIALVTSSIEITGGGISLVALGVIGIVIVIVGQVAAIARARSH